MLSLWVAGYAEVGAVRAAIRAWIWSRRGEETPSERRVRTGQTMRSSPGAAPGRT